MVVKRSLVSPSPPKRKTGGIIEMWITDENYTSPVKESKCSNRERIVLTDDLNLAEEKVDEAEEEVEKGLNKTVDSSISSSLNISDLLESSVDPDIEIEELELGECDVLEGEKTANSDKVPPLSDTDRPIISTIGEEEEMQVKQDEGSVGVINLGHRSKVFMEVRKVPVEVVDLDSEVEEEGGKKEAIPLRSKGIAVRYSFEQYPEHLSSFTCLRRS